MNEHSFTCGIWKTYTPEVSLETKSPFRGSVRSECFFPTTLLVSYSIFFLSRIPLIKLLRLRNLCLSRSQLIHVRMSPVCPFLGGETWQTASPHPNLSMKHTKW